jgi:hypothetical protein
MTGIDQTAPPVVDWLTLPDVAEQLGLDVSGVRNLIRDRHLLAVPRPSNRARTRTPARTQRKTLQVPAAMIKDGQVVKGLPGTLTVLADAGYDDEAALRWLFREDESLPGTPMTALREDRGTEVRRRAQALAF